MKTTNLVCGIELSAGMRDTVKMLSFRHAPQTPLQEFRRIVRWTLRICLVLLAAASVQLALWNRAYDPRFYHFLSTPPGRALSRLMKWPNLHNLPPGDKPEAELTDEELVCKRRLEKRLADSWPRFRLRLASGAQHLGDVLYETDHSIVFRESFGGQGQLEKEFARKDIEGIEPFTDPIPSVTWRDVRFQMEYPTFHLTWFGHYTVLTDAPYFQVSASVRELERLHGHFTETFAPLIRFPKSDQRLQVLFFSREDQYLQHQRTFAPSLGGSSGYYSPLEDRMVVFNHLHSRRTAQVRDEVRGEIQQMFDQSDSPEHRRYLLRVEDSVEEQLRLQSEQETIATLRHEAAHHLSYTYGIHSWHHSENAWLIEGLAVYFEPSSPGTPLLPHLSTLLRLSEEGRIPPLASLVNIRQPENFEAELPGIQAYEAYALSWSLFHFCMSPPHRERFFAFLRMLQSDQQLREVAQTPQHLLLARALGFSPDELDHAWRLHLSSL